MRFIKYKQERTLARRLKRPSGERPTDFKRNVSRLRAHFERFNLDVSEVCQWLMGLRPGGKRGGEKTNDYWHFFLKPTIFLTSEDETDGDRVRRSTFDFITNIPSSTALEDLNLTPQLIESIRATAGLQLTPTSIELFKRISVLSAAHRQVLLKAASEWVFARYQRGMDNWVRKHEEWQTEKEDWEKEHPELTVPAMAEFDILFRKLGIRDKRPRLCGWETLKKSRNNCDYAGEAIKTKKHAALCKKYHDFSKQYEKGKHKKDFESTVKEYLEIRRDKRYNSFGRAMEEFIGRDRNRRQWFKKAWPQYLTALGINETTALGGPGHCFNNFDKGCEFNKHQPDCERYYSLLSKQPQLQPLEALYREWRGAYLSGPSKPSFKYPSSKALPMPKIFGRGFFKVNREDSILSLRLDDMPEGEYLRFGFASWPANYSPQPKEAAITSVHIHFVGVRARVGFRFEVKHEESRFGVTQEEIDELRSHTYPRQKQDGLFLDAVRRLLLDSFKGEAKDLVIMCVDLGTRGGGACIFKGKELIETAPLKLLKIDELYHARPAKYDSSPEKGLGVAHAGRHLEKWAASASEISKKRNEMFDSGSKQNITPSGLGNHDLRGLTQHMRGMYKDWVRLNAAQIIEMAVAKKANLIVFESLRGFSIPGRDKIADEEKRRKAFWSHGRIRHKVKEKAVEQGMRVIGVPDFKSSQICAECGKTRENHGLWLKNKNKGIFKCEICGHESNSDENAARVLGKFFWGDIPHERA